MARWSWSRVIVGSTLFASFCVLVFADQTDQSLSIQNENDVWIITYQKSPVTIRIPHAGDFRMVASMVQSRPRYLYLMGVDTGITISGWFEPSEKYKGLAGFWESESAGLSTKLNSPPTNVVLGKAGDWEVVSYDLSTAQILQSRPVAQALKDMPAAQRTISVNLRAEYSQAGTWVDLHISKGTDSTHVDETRRQLASLLGQIKPSVSALPDRTKVTPKEIEDAVTNLTDGIETLDDAGYERATAILDRYLKNNDPFLPAFLAPDAHPWTSDADSNPQAVAMLNVAFLASLIKDQLHHVKDDTLYSAWTWVIKYYRHYRDPKQTGGPVWKKIWAVERLIGRQEKGTLRDYAKGVRLYVKLR